MSKSYLNVAVLVAFAGCVAVVNSPALALNMPSGDCPCVAGPWFTTPGCYVAQEICVRTDGAAVQTNAGTPTMVVGESHNCNNCGPNTKCADCQKNPPPPMNCVAPVNVSYTSTWTITGTGGISGDIGPVKASFQLAVGKSWAWAYSVGLQCGSSTFPACKNGTYAAQLNVMTGAQYQVTSTYGLSILWKGTCGTSTTPYWDWWACSQTTTATASGDLIGQSNCAWMGYSPCPADQ